MKKKESQNEGLTPFKYRPPSKSAYISDEENTNIVLVPGFQGVPIRNVKSRGTMTREDVSKLVVTWDIHFKIFDMSDAADTEIYERLQTAAATLSQHVRVIKETYPEGFGKEHWKIAVKWGERYLEPQPYKGVRVYAGSPTEG